MVRKSKPILDYETMLCVVDHQMEIDAVGEFDPNTYYVSERINTGDFGVLGRNIKSKREKIWNRFSAKIDWSKIPIDWNLSPWCEREEEFQSIFEKECWLWNGKLTDNGYGVFHYNGKKQYAHRVAFSFSGSGEVPPKTPIYHSCSNKNCVNPFHLYVEADTTAGGSVYF